MSRHSGFGLRVLVLAIAALVILTGCAPSRIGISWAALGVHTLNDQTVISVAYTQQINFLDPVTGRPVPLVDADGQNRLDEQGNVIGLVVDSNAITDASFRGAQFFASPLISESENRLRIGSYEKGLLDVDLLFPKDRNITTMLPFRDVDGDKNNDGDTFVIAAPAIDETTYYFPLKLGGVIAIDRTSGEKRWSFKTGKGVWASPLLVDGILYIPSLDHLLYAVDVETGESVWASPPDLKGSVVSTPLYYNDYLYVGSYSHILYKIDLRGNIVAEAKAQNWIWSTPVIHNEVLYTTDMSGYVHAINPATMEIIWSKQVADRGIRPAPIVTDKYVIVASRNGRVYWLEPTDGATIFERDIENHPEILSELLFVPANPDAGIDEDLVIVSTVDLGRLVAAYSVENGRAVWVYNR